VQGFPDGDPGAEQRRGGGGIQTDGKSVGEPFADDVLAGVAPQGGGSVAPVDTAVSQGREGVAEVLLAGPAHGALSARIDDVADRHGVADGKARDARPCFGHHARELVPRHQVAPFSVVAADGVQIGVADTAVVHPDREVVRAQVPPLYRCPSQRRRRAVRLPASCCPHGTSP
jgi:hypothetical protein